MVCYKSVVRYVGLEQSLYQVHRRRSRRCRELLLELLHQQSHTDCDSPSSQSRKIWKESAKVSRQMQQHISVEEIDIVLWHLGSLDFFRPAFVASAPSTVIRPRIIDNLSLTIPRDRTNSVSITALFGTETIHYLHT